MIIAVFLNTDLWINPAPDAKASNPDRLPGFLKTLAVL